MQTPYTMEARPETGVRNAQLGMWLFLAASAMFFGALFSSYAFLKAAGVDWNERAQQISSAPAIVQSALLVFASICAWVSTWKLKRRSYESHWGFGAGSVMFTALFVVGLVSQFWRLIADGATPASHTLFALYFLLTGCVAIHALGAALVMAWVLTFGRGVHGCCPEMYANRVHGVAVFGTFCTLMWLVTAGLFTVYR